MAGARPNFIKIAPLINELQKQPRVSFTLAHTGQHYDRKLSAVFFEELGIPKPDIDLGIGSETHAVQTGKILIAFDAVLERQKPDLVIVVGDVNSTIACSLAAAKRGIRVAHVEAGLRSFDWTMPEEINRVLTDRISDFLFCTESSAVKNLRREGIVARKIFTVGNVMIDTLLRHRKKAETSKILKNLRLEKKQYAVATLHRPSNVDNPAGLAKVLRIFKKISAMLPLVLPLHPRTQKQIERYHLDTQGITLTEPLPYLDFRKLMSHATLVLTDSGGIQEETTILNIPCLTLRENTERPITVTHGTNLIVGTDEKKIFRAINHIFKNPTRKNSPIKFWDGKTAKRIVKILIKALNETASN